NGSRFVGALQRQRRQSSLDRPITVAERVSVWSRPYHVTGQSRKKMLILIARVNPNERGLPTLGRLMAKAGSIGFRLATVALVPQSFRLVNSSGFLCSFVVCLVKVVGNAASNIQLGTCFHALRSWQSNSRYFGS